MMVTGTQTICVIISILTLSRADTGSFWHVADFHYDPSYRTTGDSCKNRTDTTNLGRYGNYMCDAPWLLISESVEAMKRIEPNVDFVIWTGDDTPHVADSKLSEDDVVDIVTNLTQLLNETFQDIPVYAALGNHDYHPKNQMPPSANYLYQGVWQKWKNWVNESDAENTFLKGGYYTLKVTPGLRMVILNSVLYYKSNKVTSNMDDPANQFTWFDNLMTTSAQNNEKVYVVTHIPPGMFEKHVSWNWMPEKFNKRLEELIVKHAPVISGIFYGHHHTDTFRMFYDADGTAVASGFIAPAVTPWKTTLPNGIGSLANNPAIRLIKYDRDTYKVNDIWQYYLNLTAANLAPSTPLKWDLEYKFTNAYNIRDVTTDSMQQVVKSFVADGSGSFQKYINFNSVNFQPGEVCVGQCKAAQYCSVTKVDKAKYTACFEDMTKPNSSPKITTLATIFSAFFVTILLF